MDLLTVEETLGIGVQVKCNLLVRESFVKLCHDYLLDEFEAASMRVRPSSEKSSLFKWKQFTFEFQMTLEHIRLDSRLAQTYNPIAIAGMAQW